MNAHNPRVRDPVAALQQVNPHARPLAFKRGHQSPRLMTGHFQGIQRLSNIGTDMYYAMTRNAWSGAFLIVIRVPQHGRGEIVTKLRLPSDGRGRPLKHPGGFQVVGDYAAICVEDARGKRRSQIQFFDVIRPAQPKQVTHLTLNRHGRTEVERLPGQSVSAQEGQITCSSWEAGDPGRSISTNRTESPWMMLDADLTTWVNGVRKVSQGPGGIRIRSGGTTKVSTC